MAEGIIYPKGVVPRNKDFREAQKMRGEVYNFLKNTMEETAEFAFNTLGYNQKAAPAGFYGDGNAYGYGVDEGAYNVKVGSKTDSYLEKRLSLGGKRIVVEMHMTIHPATMTVEMHYKNTEDAAFRGFQEGKGGYMINEKIIMNCANMDKFKKEMTKKLKEFSEKEIGFITMTKLGNEDGIEKSTASVVEGFTLSSLFSDDFESTEKKITESFNIDETKPRPIVKQEPAEYHQDTEGNTRANGKPRVKVKQEPAEYPQAEQREEKDDLILGDKMNESEGEPYSAEQVKNTLNTPYAQSTFFVTNYGNVLSPSEALDWDHEDTMEWIVKGEAHWEGEPMYSESGEEIPSAYGEEEVSEITSAGGAGGAGGFAYDAPINATRKRNIASSAPFDQPVNEGKSDTVMYKGAKIEPLDRIPGYKWMHTDYYDYAPDTGQYGAGEGDTVKDCMRQIDDFLKSQTSAGEQMTESQKRFNNTPYARSLRENRRPTNHTRIIPEGTDGFWQVVPQETLDGYKKNHIMGAPGAEGIEVNSDEEEEYNSGGVQKYPGGKSHKHDLKESEDRARQKYTAWTYLKNAQTPVVVNEIAESKTFIVYENANPASPEVEANGYKVMEVPQVLELMENGGYHAMLVGVHQIHQESVNESVSKRYTRVGLTTQTELNERWKRLATMKDAETIHAAESVIPDSKEIFLPKRGITESVEGLNSLSRDGGIEEGESVDGKLVIEIEKPMCLAPVYYKVFKEDYENTGKAFLWDFNTGMLVNNPGFKI